MDAVSNGAVLANEFASVRVGVDRSANGVRVQVEDIETGKSVYLDPLELASLCHASPEDRLGWLRVGPYGPDAVGREDTAGEGDAEANP